MSRVLNFGSINVDHVYAVEHFVRPGETLASHEYRRFAGGKGLNQSIALARAGAEVYHAGKLGTADTWLLDLMDEKGVDTRYVEAIEGPSGHAIIQVNDAGENAIIIVGAANRLIGPFDIERCIADFGLGDYLLLQNEVSAVAEIIWAAKEKGMTVVFNPAPMGAEVSVCPLDRVDILILNEVEARGLTGETGAEPVFSVLRQRFPQMTLVLTQGKNGAIYDGPAGRYFQPAEPVAAVDTTGAGDTFIGFFLAELIGTGDPQAALRLASRAAALCVTRPGAAESIPAREELAAG